MVILDLKNGTNEQEINNMKLKLKGVEASIVEVLDYL